ncbi:MAG: TonB-dependent receptor [Lentisphaeraceae bacterium]|nr:TonB-dependent receptor [Lentisphaeraceae bacterium]
MKNIFLVLVLAVSGFSETTETEVENKKKLKETIIVTATGTEKDLSTSSLSAGKVEKDEIESIRPAHPSEVVNRVPGAIVNNLSGESHFTAIRNNLSTGADYLFLENGVPTRSTGFFNHNALYEINVPQSSGMEIIKGPGTALYGSDAMHGVINVLSGEIPDERLIKLGMEYGFQNWYRHLLTYGDRLNDQHAFRLDLNQTFNDGWREYSEYQRHSASLQWLWTPSEDFEMKTVLAYNYVDQSLVSGLSKFDWKHNPDDNYFRIPGRDVESYRLSSKMTKYLDADSEISITPYARYSSTSGLIPSWLLSTNPAPFADSGEIWDNGFKSYGTLLKYTQNFDKWDSLLVAGFDFDYSPGYYKVEEVAFDREFNANGNVYFNDFEKTGTVLRDFDATYTSYSPYIHFETSPFDDWRFDFGLRYDYATFEHDQKLSGNNLIPDTTVSFDQLSPKLGFVFDITDNHHLYGSYRRGFRAPSAGTLFDADADERSTDLEPTTIDSYELGIRGNITDSLSYDLTLYYMDKKDDIITFRDPNNPSLDFKSNNGRSTHKGIELGLKWEVYEELDFKVSASYSQHKFKEWDLGLAQFPGAPSGTELEGNELERAPKYYQTYVLNYHPHWMKGGSIEMEVIYQGSYYTDSRNSDKYGGYQLLNLRAEYPVNDNLKVYGRLMNVFDSDYTSFTSSSTATGFRPGEPRSLFLGFEYTF